MKQDDDSDRWYYNDVDDFGAEWAEEQEEFERLQAGPDPEPEETD